MNDSTPGTTTADDRYLALESLADLFEQTSEELRDRAALGPRLLADEEVAPSGELSPATWREVTDEVLAATTGKHGLLARSTALEADALALRATVLTYRWIDDLRDTAARTLGQVAARAVGYLVPEVALGGPIVQAGAIETDALDRAELAAYLNQLADENPALRDHFVGGGGLVESLELRGLLTSPALAGDDRGTVARGGLRAIGADDFAEGFSAALRDVAVGHVDERVDEALRLPPAEAAAPPASLEELVQRLTSLEAPVHVQPLGGGRHLALLTGATRGALADGDVSERVSAATEALTRATEGTPGARVLLAGVGHGGLVAAELATTDHPFSVDQVVTVNAPAAQATQVPPTVPVLALEDRSDPVALLGSLLNAEVSNRLTVVYDGGTAAGTQVAVVGGRAADTARHPEVRAALQRLRDLGYLA